MNKNRIEEIALYEAPSVEVILTVVEHGFTASYGDEGEAGDEFYEKDWGEF